MEIEQTQRLGDVDSLGTEGTDCSDHPSFLITIDTEGDDLWSQPSEISAKNARFLPRFQELCERYGFKPTYLTNWEMAESEVFQEFGRDILKRNAGEIGLHVHAWHSPPDYQLTTDDYFFQPYLIEYPEDVIRSKVQYLTDRLEDLFDVKMVSHRAGRWAFNATYARILQEAGYRVDCSVTPHLSWRETMGDPNGRGGTDYTGYPDFAYYLNLDDPSTSGSSNLLEVPVTVIVNEYPAPAYVLRSAVERLPLGPRVMTRLMPLTTKLRPTRRNLKSLLSLLSTVREENRDYAEFILHSSELMPAGSPCFPTGDDIEKLYDDLEVLFSEASSHWVGRTLSEYADMFDRKREHERVISSA